MLARASTVRTSACDELSRVAQARPVWFNQINKTNQTNQLDGILSLAACGRPAAAASAIGRTGAETGEADGDGGSFAWRAADG
ncbi:MAG: hypothetical protein AAB177_06005, partial [Nitrospirota bacterium]